jgi:hypothetical protein
VLLPAAQRIPGDLPFFGSGLPGDYPSRVKLTRKETGRWQARLERSAKLPKYDITIKLRSEATAGI